MSYYYMQCAAGGTAFYVIISFYFLSLRSAYNFIVYTGSQDIYNGIKNCKEQKCKNRSDHQKFRIGHCKQKKQFLYDRKRKSRMDPRQQQWQQKYGKHLGMDTASDLPFCHADFPHNIKPCLIFKPFCDLLIIHDQHCCCNEYNGKEYAQNKKPAI